MFLVVLPLFVVAHLSHHLVAALITPLLPFIRDTFALDYTQAGMLVSAFTLAYGIGQLPGGWLSDHLGFHRLITIGISGVALCGIFIGISTHYIMVLIFLVLMGLLGGGYHPSASPLISSAVESKMRGRALGIHQIGGTGSYFLSPLIAVGIAQLTGWRGSFLFISIPVFLYGIVFFILLNRWGYGKAYMKDTRESRHADEDVPTKIRYLVPVIILNAAVPIFIFSAVSFIPFYVVDNFGGSKEAAAVLLSLANSAGLWAGPLGGYMSDRIGKIPIILFTGLIAGPFIFLLNHVTFGVSISVLLLLLGMTQYMSMPVAESFIISHSPGKSRSTVLGIYYFASRGGPGLLTPFIGYLIDHNGFYTAYLYTGLLMFFIAAPCSAFIALNQKRYKQ